MLSVRNHDNSDVTRRYVTAVLLHGHSLEIKSRTREVVLSFCCSLGKLFPFVFVDVKKRFVIGLNQRIMFYIEMGWDDSGP